MAFNIKKDIRYIGKIDWELRNFHGEEFSTHHGSSYNSYLIKDKKNVLIDTVWGKYDDQFLTNLKKEIPLEKIDYIVINHGETDHSGALPELMREIPNTPIYCSANGVKSLTGHYHQNWNFQVVKTGDRLKIGSRELVFFEASMLHWPDTMMTYLTGDKILFSSDVFGQHLASEFMYNDLVDQAELYREAMKYYAIIVTPYSPVVDKKIKEFLALDLPVEMICPAHGMIWRKDPYQIINSYLEWANNYQENQVTLIYDTMWEGTRRMAEAIAQGITETDKTICVKLFNAARSDISDIIVEAFKSKVVLVGSPTVNNTMLRDVAAVLEEMRGMRFKNKKAAAFGCYGWGGEAARIISNRLEEGGFELLNEGIRAKWNPDDAALACCIDYGKRVAEVMK